MTVTRKKNAAKINSAIMVGGLKGMEAWAMIVAQSASLKAPVGKPRKRHPVFHGSEWIDQSTRLATSIHVDPKGPQIINDGGYISFTHRVGTNLVYAKAQEMGSGLYSETGARRKYPIVAGNLQEPPMAGGRWSLFFYWPAGPKNHPAHYGDSWFHFAYVMHPGVHAQPYLRPALHDSQEIGKRLVFGAIKAELQK